MQFNIEATAQGTSARAGTLKLSHGEVPTPIFMPVGTAGTVKSVHQRELENDVNAPIILGNTYHLYLRPGLDVIQNAGGLHKFIGWDRNILTDSGGYQVYSLSKTRKITEEGAKFQSFIDGSYHMFTPEYAIDIQRIIGADIIMAFDECTPYPCDYNYAKTSMELTHRWLKRCLDRFNETEPLYGYGQVLFPIVQGSVYEDLRMESAKFMAEQELPGIAIGGLSVGEPNEIMYSVTEKVCEVFPAHKPRYLMGVGTPADLLECIDRGIDMFDCVMPTRNARHGHIFTPEGIINIRNLKWKKDYTPVNPFRMSFLDEYYSKAYLRHLVLSDEILGAQIATLHNLTFYLWLVREARSHIVAGDFASWKKDMLPKVQNRL